MKLITKEIEKAFDRQGYVGDKEPEDIKIICKFFNPAGAGTWYLYEKENEDIYWCFANLGDPMCAECGTVSMNELTSLRLPFGLGIERDMHFPIGKYSLKEIQEGIRAGKHF